jgi:oxygen-independent coproporphyrinogen-3 oxidase
MNAAFKSQELGIYVHWPFCQSKCPYCDFNSHVADHVDQRIWERAYLAELDRYALETEGRLVRTVFFGGGTPSLMQPDLVSAILDRIRRKWRVANDWEVTLEANPGSVDAGRFAGYRQAGVNRLSMGVQALNDTDLKRLGRLHSVRDAQEAFAIARSHFNRVSFDLIYARQDQTLEQWKSELSIALAMAVDHLSLYQLTIEDGTAFGDRAARGKLAGLPDEERSATLYELTQEMCAAAGMTAYEVSNHARTGAESQHNLIYWRGGDYLGVGPGAHGRLSVTDGRLATEAARQPGLWLRKVETEGNGEVVRDALTATDRGMEYLTMSLRLSEGMDVGLYEHLAQRPLDARAASDLDDLGYINLSKGRLIVSPSGRLVLNSVIRHMASSL